MPTELEFSVMSSSSGNIQELLDQFETETGIHVRLRLLAWDSAWGMFVRSALYNDGPDVSEVGTTWMGDLVGMNALRPYGTAEVVGLGKPAAFFPTAWKTAVRPLNASPITAGAADERTWGIPWLTGARLIFYRPQLLAQAGIDPQEAFQTNAALEAAVRRLASTGAQIPWTVPTGYTHTTLLNIASWVWAAGGDFIAPDGKSTSFMQPEALQGLCDYFTLGRYLPREVRGLNGLEPDDAFLSNPDTAMTISGPWLFCRARQQLGNLSDQFGVALPPGAPFVGGSNLIIWKYSRNPEAAVKLVRFLTQKSAQVRFCQNIGLLPARVEALDSQPFSSDPFWGTAVEGLKTGRTFPAIRLWGLVEDRLTAGFSAVWTDVLAGEDPHAALLKHLQPLAHRLDQLLEKE